MGGAGRQSKSRRACRRGCIGWLTSLLSFKSALEPQSPGRLLSEVNLFRTFASGLDLLPKKVFKKVVKSGIFLRWASFNTM